MPPDRASSREITFTSPDAPADGIPRKIAYERHLSRRRSSQSEELTMNGGQARTPSQPVVPAGPKVVPNRDYFVFLSGTLGILSLWCLTQYTKQSYRGRGVDVRTAQARNGAPKSPRWVCPKGGSNPRLAPYIIMIFFFLSGFLLFLTSQHYCGVGDTLERSWISY